MTIAYLNDYHKYGTIFGAYLSRKKAIELRTVSGDLLFDSDGKIDQNEDWLFDWERKDPNCYAKRQQRLNLSLKEFRIIN